MRRHLHGVIMIATAAMFGCGTPNRQYQPADTVKVSDGTYIEDTSPYLLRAIEFDEQGIMWDAGQRTSALGAIRESRRRPLLIVFIHGWHHNANPNDTDLKSFNKLLSKLATSGALPARSQVVGVFMGWRGLSTRRELDWTGIGWAGRHLGFYSRKNRTDKIAGINLTQTLYELSSAARQKGGRVIFVGHSFGGRILEKAVAQALIGQSADLSGSKRVSTPADLTLLLNPASEALTARQLKLALQNWPGNTPPIISLTSTTDSATRLAWPLATGLTASLDDGYRRLNEGVNERDYVTSTAGHSPMVRDRTVEESPGCLVNISPPENAVSYNIRSARIDCIRAAGKWWQIREIAVSSGPIVMKEKQARGYWVMQVPDEIISGHGGIFKDSAIEFIAGLYKICGPEFDRRSVTLTPVTE